MPMPGHDRLQVFPTLVFYALILGNHDHAICRFGCTGSHQIVPVLYLNHTDAAALTGLFRPGIFYFVFAMENSLNRGAVFSRRQIRMVTQTGDKNIDLTGGFQNRRPCRHFNRLSINGQIYGIHFQIYSDFSFLFSIS
jgi:hypothetical protein